MPLMQRDLGSLQALFDQAKESQTWFVAQVKQFAAESEGKFDGLANFKEDKNDPGVPSARAYEKAQEKGVAHKNPEKGYRYVKDLIRVSVVYKGCTGVTVALEKIPDYFHVVEAKDHFTSPKPSRYADFNIIVQHPENCHLCELQIHFDSMLAAKKAGGHEAYRRQRTVSEGVSIRNQNDRLKRARTRLAVLEGWGKYHPVMQNLSRDQKAVQQMLLGFEDLLEKARRNASARPRDCKVGSRNASARPRDGKVEPRTGDVLPSLLPRVTRSSSTPRKAGLRPPVKLPSI